MVGESMVQDKKIYDIYFNYTYYMIPYYIVTNYTVRYDITHDITYNHYMT